MNVERLKVKFTADNRRVILLPFEMNGDRTSRILAKLMELSEEKVEKLFSEILNDFSERHRDFTDNLIIGYQKVSDHIETQDVSEKRKMLIGAYFSKEYSIESAALFNPSMVPHPDQSGLRPGELRFILILRATGEGHISSIEFREGIVTADNAIVMVDASRQASLPEYERATFPIDKIKSFVGESVSNSGLQAMLEKGITLDKFKKVYQDTIQKDKSGALGKIMDYLDSNYSAIFSSEFPVSERVLFPFSESECMGMEDARFVRFQNDDGSYKYFGTYTAYNGRSFRTQLIETNDFLNYEVRTMTGNGVLDKGLAIFPRKVNGVYNMISRQDGENLYIMKSNDLYHWENAEKLMTPENDWEFVQVGNCGSPIETDEGWLVITHAVGAMRKYVISAVLLNLDEPEKIIGRCDKPILSPDASEREGYVPNVVYSCGSIIKDDELILPYAMSDSASGFAKITVKEILDEIK